MNHGLRRGCQRAAAPRAAIAALAAAVSYFIAHEVFGHSSPFFAPVSAVIVLGITIGAQLQRALQLALGVAVGILAADLLVALIGNGGWQIGVIVFEGTAIGAILCTVLTVLVECGLPGFRRGPGPLDAYVAAGHVLVTASAPSGAWTDGALATARTGA